MSAKTFHAFLTGISVEKLEPPPGATNQGWELKFTAMQNEPQGNKPPTMAYMLFEQQVIDLYNLLRAQIETSGLDTSTPPSDGNQRH